MDQNHHTIVIFGASGDLTERKLIPALYRLARDGRLQNVQIVGVSRTAMTHEAWRASLADSTAGFLPDDFDPVAWEPFAERLFYHAADLSELEQMRGLATALQNLEGGQPTDRLYYLSTSPRLYEAAVANLGRSGLAESGDDPIGPKVVFEKPFGIDLATAHRLNESIHAVFKEDQVFRIDHYLGKETVQNILVLRFANSVFEPIWNRQYIDHVQITVAESVDVSSRADYFDHSGVLRDMVQNHLLQLMMITSMEVPSRFEPKLVRDEKVKILQAVRPLAPADLARHTLRAQYEGYGEAEGVAAGSETATFAALKLFIDSWRWQGVPFYLRSGKAMSCRTTQIVIQFHEPPQRVFDSGQQKIPANRLVIQIQPAEGLQLHFQSKVPDQGMRTRTSHLDYRFQDDYSHSLPDAYERLLVDAIEGDASLFARSDEVELAWQIIDPIVAAWDSEHAPPLFHYPYGEWGPLEANAWMAEDGREWFDVCPVLR